jgi:trans-aconitate methyltransferase
MLLFVIISVSIAVCLTVFCFFVYLSDGFFGKLDFTTGRLAADNVVKILKDYSLQNGNFYDLGSCRGEFAKEIAKNFPNLKVCGIDDSSLRIFLSNARGLFLKNLQFEKQDIFNSNFSSANVVYLYLPQELMPELETKLQKELKPGALAISASVSFPNWQPEQIYDLDRKRFKVPKIFVYKQI